MKDKQALQKKINTCIEERDRLLSLCEYDNAERVRITQAIHQNMLENLELNTTETNE